MSITLNDIQKAKERIAPYITETPLLRLHSLDTYLGCQVYAKAECMQITGAFKLRGALNKRSPAQHRRTAAARHRGRLLR